jgi:hypothetical protein
MGSINPLNLLHHNANRYSHTKLMSHQLVHFPLSFVLILCVQWNINNKARNLETKHQVFNTMVILITKQKPADVERYLRAAAETVLLFKIAYDIIKLLSGFLI